MKNQAELYHYKTARKHPYAAQFFLVAIVALCLFTTVDTHLFLASSLSRSLGMTLLVGMLSVSTILLTIKEKSVTNSVPEMLLLLWVAYILLSPLWTEFEMYRILYLSMSVFCIMAIASLSRYGFVTVESLDNVVLSVAVLHIICMALQSIDVVSSGNEFFKLTGCNENPTVTALYLTGAIPLAVRRIVKGEHIVWYVALLVASLLCIVLLECRTAYIGLTVMCVVAIMSCAQLRRRCRRYRWPVVASLLALSVPFAVRLYNMKKDSADGRMLVWRLSARMVYEKPQGYGYGLFERNYNLRQAAYFENEKYTETERRNASFVAMAYNDYLEQGVEGGVVGMLFLIAFYVLFISKAYRQRQYVELSVIAAFAVMSLSNFVYSSIQGWLLLVLNAGVVLGVRTKSDRCWKIGRLSRVVMCLLLLMLLRSIAIMAVSQYNLKVMDTALKNGGRVCADDFEHLRNSVATSEIYWQLRADYEACSGDYACAMMSQEEALRYTSSPAALFAASRYCYQAGDTAKGVRYLCVLYYYMPNLLMPKLMLMRHCAQATDTVGAVRYAEEILVTEQKTVSPKAAWIRREAASFLAMTGASTPSTVNKLPHCGAQLNVGALFIPSKGCKSPRKNIYFN